MFKLNAFAHEHSLREMINWSKIWEYPWIWFHVLLNIDFEGKTVVDLGSEISPIPWLLALKGAKVVLIETDRQYLSHWNHMNEKLGLKVEWKFVNDEKIPLPDNSADIVTSYSVLEHQPDKNKAVEEVIRILKPGGVFALSFDICESDLGMTFPDWNGSAINLDEFENILWNNPAFQKSSKPEWNLNDITSFWQWHVNTAPHHNYVSACAVFNILKENANHNNIYSKERIDKEIVNVSAQFSTPVLFLIYNRTEFTERVFNEIRKIKPNKLYVAADGPKPNDESDKRKCNTTRNIIKDIDWKCEVKTLFRTEHLGCKIGVSSAIDWFFENEIRGIILEDDILPSVTFWKFCEEMLDKYADDSRIMHITGNNLQLGWRRNNDSYYFSLYGSIW
jgi:SAM-dependent methyltransferase